MNFEQCRDYCLEKLQSVEDFPFGPELNVFKVCNKVFAILGVEQGIARVNLKCDPAEALALRDIFEAVIPGYHMNKKHWNTVILNGSIPENEIKRQIDNSWLLVVATLPKAKQPVLA